MKKHAGHGYKHTHIEHHADGSHTMHHEHEDGKSHKKYAVQSLDHVHDGMQDHLGSANPGEGMDEHNQPMAAAAPAAAPAAAAPAAMPGA
ncbi:Uncharacterised protein [uncultured archaeon]|nr:Uncharacterised protein [uncultured archaeon]